MDLEEIKALLAVAEYGSFVAAARSSHMTRSTLRRRIDELEARVGTVLLERTASGARLTPAGHIVVREGRIVAEHARSLLQAARTVGPEADEPLTVVCQLGMPAELLAAVFALVEARLPGTRWTLAFSSNPVASLIDDADLVVAITAEPVDRAWTAVRLRGVREWLFANESWLAAHGTPANLSDLATARLAVWQAPGLEAGRLPLRGGGSLDVRPALSTPDVHLLHTLASTGNALVYAPDGLVGPLLSGQSPMAPVLPELVGRDLAVWLLVPPVVAESARVKVIVEAVRALVAPVLGPV